MNQVVKNKDCVVATLKLTLLGMKFPELFNEPYLVHFWPPISCIVTKCNLGDNIEVKCRVASVADSDGGKRQGTLST